jgi:hypothetical protein
VDPGGRTPVVPAAVADPRRARPDPQLDADLARWHEENGRRSAPLVAVLGEPAVRAPGTAPAEPRYAEALVHLALHPQGVTPEQARADLWPDGAVDEEMARVVAWAGTDRRTRPPTSFVSTDSDGRYRLRGHLLDWELFERLRLRGRDRAARNQPGGTADYRSALRLVRGPILRPPTDAGYRWVARDGRRMDRYILRSVVAAAHELVDLALAADDTATAQRAAELARKTDVRHSFDRPLTDLMRVAHARSNPAEVERLAAVLLDLRGVEVAEELAPVTFAVVDTLLPDGVTRPAPAARPRRT